MTSFEYAEKTRISSILRAIRLDSSTRPLDPGNSSAANSDLDLLGMVLSPPPCATSPQLPPWAMLGPQSRKSLIHFLDFAGNPAKRLDARTLEFVHIWAYPVLPRSLNFRAQFPVADNVFHGVEYIHRGLLIGFVAGLLFDEIGPNKLLLCHCYW